MPASTTISPPTASQLPISSSSTAGNCPAATRAMPRGDSRRARIAPPASRREARKLGVPPSTGIIDAADAELAVAAGAIPRERTILGAPPWMLEADDVRRQEAQVPLRPVVRSRGPRRLHLPQLDQEPRHPARPV